MSFVDCEHPETSRRFVRYQHVVSGGHSTLATWCAACGALFGEDRVWSRPSLGWPLRLHALADHLEERACAPSLAGYALADGLRAAAALISGELGPFVAADAAAFEAAPPIALITLLREHQRKDTTTMQADPIMQFFEYEHLPPKLQEISKPFCELAKSIVADAKDATPGTTLGIPRNAERTVALRKLLEAKDCAVRASLFKPAEG